MKYQDQDLEAYISRPGVVEDEEEAKILRVLAKHLKITGEYKRIELKLGDVVLCDASPRTYPHGCFPG